MVDGGPWPSFLVEDYESPVQPLEARLQLGWAHLGVAAPVLGKRLARVLLQEAFHYGSGGLQEAQTPCETEVAPADTRVCSDVQHAAQRRAAHTQLAGADASLELVEPPQPAQQVQHKLALAGHGGPSDHRHAPRPHLRQGQLVTK